MSMATKERLLQSRKQPETREGRLWKRLPTLFYWNKAKKEAEWRKDKGGLAWRKGCCCSPLDLANTAPYSFRYRDIFFFIVPRDFLGNPLPCCKQSNLN
ncbi:hypothetical protein VNO77_46380 [Canavalia gladiata]|uniref:Uncharacterized protein n=1 Tax=Canavalia gladiata TaxID=3824 RepID=A0AAN9PGW3_CANGL